MKPSDLLKVGGVYRITDSKGTTFPTRVLALEDELFVWYCPKTNRAGCTHYYNFDTQTNSLELQNQLGGWEQIYKFIGNPDPGVRPSHSPLVHALSEDPLEGIIVCEFCDVSKKEEE